MRKLNALLSICVVLCISGCKKPEVDFDEVFTEPTATIQDNTIILTGGPHRLASIHYVAPRARIETDTIYVYGVMTTDATAMTNRVVLPSKEPAGGWTIKWINKNGATIEMRNR
jgi:hypothetical protein